LRGWHQRPLRQAAAANQSQGKRRPHTAGSLPETETRSGHRVIRHLIFINAGSVPSGQTVTMQRILHIFSCFVLALSLALSGPGVAGPVKGAMLVELCADGSAQQIWLDADGNPVQPAKSHAKCLDCLLFSAPLPDATTVTLAFGPLRSPERSVLPGAPETTPAAHLRPIPRAPPAAESEAGRPGDLRPLIPSLHLSALAPLDSHQAARAPVTGPRAIL
jgi:hypothetical protein